ncbi:MAG: hypothetical protein M3O30_07045 [Planctomycetota bacterium]|nr:hypothetical protein [Planctomycetota bacterium]
MEQLSRVRASLQVHGIRDASDYAEVLIAESLGGQRVASRVNKGHDVLCGLYGRVEVKCRQLPAAGRLEERVEISAAKEAGFDFLAVVIFHSDFRVKGAVLVPYGVVWELTAHQQYNRISYSQASQLIGAIDISGAVRLAADK